MGLVAKQNSDFWFFWDILVSMYVVDHILQIHSILYMYQVYIHVGFYQFHVVGFGEDV